MNHVMDRFTHTLHEYERSKTRKNIYRCRHPKCPHYKDRELLEGKEAACHKCKQPFILTWQQLRNKHPVCDFCMKSPRSLELRNIREAAFKSMMELPDELKDILNEEDKN